MKIATLMVVLSTFTFGQSAPPTPPHTTPMKAFSIGDAITPADVHGCRGSQWDAEKRACTVHILFAPNTPLVKCSVVTLDKDGSQHVVCWYTPAS